VSPRTQSLRRTGWTFLAALVVIVVFVAVLGRLGSRSGGGSDSAPAGPTRTDARPTLGAQGPETAGEWTFDEGAGRAVADTAGGSPLALQAGAEWTAAGKSGPAVAFDGTRGYGETSRSVVDPAGSWTVTAWVRLDRFPDGFGTAVSEDGGADSALALQYVPSRRWALGVPGNVRVLSQDPPVRGRWTQLAGVRDSTTGQLTLYVDGVAQGSVRYAGRPGAAGPLAVGRGLSNGAKVQFFPGAVDSVRAYGGALTAEEVRAAYQSGD
jgi:Concanavalin A-like lectin/glucanases superfamily